MFKKIIFADIDGVIITWRSHFAFTDKPEDHRFSSGLMDKPDLVAAAFLEKLCRVYDLKIVVSSTWRSNPKKLMPLLDECDLKKFLHEDWRTEQSGLHRGTQIKNWLENHPEVIDWKIIDDDYDTFMGDYKGNESHFIECSMWNGLSGESMNTLIEWARGEKQLIV